MASYRAAILFNASYDEVRKYKGITKKDFVRIIDKAMIISIPQFSEIMDIAKLSDDQKFKASYEYTKIMADSQVKSSSFIAVFENVRNLVNEMEISEGESAWEYVNRLCDTMYKNNSKTKLIYNRMYVCVLSICILINEMRKL